MASHVISPREGLRRDEKGAYFVVCRYSWHVGLPKQPDECLQRKCVHLERIYTNSKYTLKLREDSFLYEHPMCHELTYEI